MAYNNRAALKRETNDLDGALQRLFFCSCYSDQVGSLPDELHQVYCNRADLLIEFDLLDEAMTDVASAIELVPDFPRTFEIQARIYGLKHNFHMAVQTYNKAIELDSAQRKLL